VSTLLRKEALMRPVTLFVSAALAGACAPHEGTRAQSRELRRAESLISAFYTFDPAQLRPLLADAPASAPKLLYYQGWAQGGSYVVLHRKPCRFDKMNEVSCDITVKDDLIGALGTGQHVTDTFHISFREGRIIAVRNSSNDPPEFEQALKWLDSQQPKLFDRECAGFFRNGPTPQACVREVVKGFRAYVARQK
jgi:hypothetical protein